ALIELVIGPARVEVAVWGRFQTMLTAEIEVLGQRIADWPLAGVFIELQQAEALVFRNEDFGSGGRHIELGFELGSHGQSRCTHDLRTRHGWARLADACSGADASARGCNTARRGPRRCGTSPRSCVSGLGASRQLE